MKISIIIVTHNSGKHLDNAIQSINAQKYKKTKTQKIFQHRKPLQTFQELKHFWFYKLYNASILQEK